MVGASRNRQCCPGITAAKPPPFQRRPRSGGTRMAGSFWKIADQVGA